jgi:hypothetical protein
MEVVLGFIPRHTSYVKLLSVPFTQIEAKQEEACSDEKDRQ